MFRRIAAFGMLSAVIASLTVVIDGGSQCPPRSDIYPCMCTAIPKVRQSIYTVITCSHLPSSTVLSSAVQVFKGMHIDRMIIVDSFLEAAQNYGKEADHHQKLPQDWLSHLRIRELEIIDSQLSPCFACDFSDMCQNSFQTHLSVVNSSRSDKVCTVCQVGNQTKFSWVACLSHLKYFDFHHNGIQSVERDFFPVVMDNLLELNMSYNQIDRLGKDAFRNLPKLLKLDLSHNVIRDVSSNVFGRSQMALRHLDLSWNQIITISPDVFRLTPNLRSLHLQSNLIEKLEESKWRHMSPTLRTVNLSDNRIHCDCCMTWLNTSLKTWTVVRGFCASPSRYSSTPLRRASKLLTKQCDNSRDVCY